MANSGRGTLQLWLLTCSGRHPWSDSSATKTLAESSAPRQRITFTRSSYLAMGYQRFIPAFTGVRFEKNGQRWQSFLELNDREGGEETSLDFRPSGRPCLPGQVSALRYRFPGKCLALCCASPGAKPEIAQQIGGQMDGTAGLAAGIRNPVSIHHCSLHD